MQHPVLSEFYTEYVNRRLITVFPRFTYDEVGAFKHEVRELVREQFHGRKMEKWYDLLDDIAEYVISLWLGLCQTLKTFLLI